MGFLWNLSIHVQVHTLIRSELFINFAVFPEKVPTFSGKYHYSVYYYTRMCVSWGPPRIKIWGGHKWQNKYTVYILYTGAAPEFWLGGTSEKISYMNSFQVLFCNGVSKISVGRKHSAQIYSSKTFEKFWKIYKKICTKI